MQLNDFYFELPQDLIASYPLKERSASKLLCLHANNNEPLHRQFTDILALIEPGDLLIFNDTKVIPARLYGKRSTGGKVELLVERILDDSHILAQIRSSKALKIGEIFYLNEIVPIVVVGKQQQFYHLALQNSSQPILELIEAMGEIPLPHYMQRPPEASDIDRYQTVFAKVKGSVAAPTAGFHFDEALLQKLRSNHVQISFLTLHIGAGTFTPVRCDNIKDHKMHSEYFQISKELCDKIDATKANGKKVIVVGTTSLRALETAAQSGKIQPYCGETNIFIYPGYQFQCADILVTNLHFPCSSLLMLVCAFGGHQKLMTAYKIAVQKRYRFFSYGDAMWIER